MLDCVLQTDRRFTGCRVVSETPRGGGFGAAALEQVRQMRANPAQMAEAAAGDDRRIRLGFTFLLAE